jgi:hypothetical protein
VLSQPKDDDVILSFPQLPLFYVIHCIVLDSPIVIKKMIIIITIIMFMMVLVIGYLKKHYFACSRICLRVCAIIVPPFPFLPSFRRIWQLTHPVSKNNTPVWNKRLELPFSIPLRSDSIEVQLWNRLRVIYWIVLEEGWC